MFVLLVKIFKISLSKLYLHKRAVCILFVINCVNVKSVISNVQLIVAVLP